MAIPSFVDLLRLVRSGGASRRGGFDLHNICRATSRRLGQAVRKVTVPALSHHTGLQMRAASEAEMEGAQEVPAVEGQENLLENGAPRRSGFDLHNICRTTSRRLGQTIRKVTVPRFLTGFPDLAESSACRATDVMKVEAAPPRRSVGSDQSVQV
jgi:hypothetical protein